MTSIKEALEIVRCMIQGDQIEAAIVDTDTMASLGDVVRAALAQLDSADARATLAAKVQSIFADKLSIDALNMEIDGTGPASYAVADLLISTGLLPDASPGNGAEKAREALAPFAKIADEYDDREDGDFQIWKDCDQSQTRVTLGMCRSARAALHSTSAAGEIEPALNEAEIRAGINILLEAIASKFEANDTFDIWRSDAAGLVRSYKHAAGETTSSDGAPGKQSAAGAAAAPIETEDAGVAFSPSELLFYGLTDAVGLSVVIHSIGGGKIKHEFDRSNIKQLIDALRPSEAIPAVLAMKEAWRKFSMLMIVDGDPPSIVYPTDIDANAWASAYDDLRAAIGKLSPQVKAEGGRGDGAPND